MDFAVLEISKDVWPLFGDGIGERELIGEASGICSRKLVDIRFNRIYWRQRMVRRVWCGCGVLNKLTALWLALWDSMHWAKLWRMTLLEWQRSDFLDTGYRGHRKRLLWIQLSPRGASSIRLRHLLRC